MLLLLILLLISNIYTAEAEEFTTVGAAVLEPNQKKWKNFFLLTNDNSQYTKGGIWADGQIDFKKKQAIQFYANFGANDQFGADGIVFIFKKNTTTSLGASGLFLGYGKGTIGGNYFEGITSSIAIEFDTHYNPPHDNVYDHCDIRFNGIVQEAPPFAQQVLKLSGDRNIEDEDDHEIQIVWIPGESPNYDIGTLNVYFDCELVHNLENFDINNQTSGDPVNWGLTAATGTSNNNHRVKVAPFGLEVSQEEMECGNVQLRADFPNMCDEVIYDWTPHDGLINYNTSTPIAFKSGEYTCTVKHKTETGDLYEAFFRQGVTTTGTLNVVVDAIDYSYQKIYGNSYIYNGFTYESEDGICGTVMAADCGYLINGWSEFSTGINHLNSFYKNGYNNFLMKTDYHGNLIWTKNYIYTNGIDLNNLSQIQKENYEFYSIVHSAVIDFSLQSNLANETDGKFENGNSEKIQTGYILTGEMSNPYSFDESFNMPRDINTFILKLDNNGNIKASLEIEVENEVFQSGKKIYQLINDDYILKETNLNSIKLYEIKFLDYNNNNNDKLEILNSYYLSPNSIFISEFAGDYSDIISIPIEPESKVLSEYSYKHLLAYSYKDLNGLYRNGIAFLNDLTESNINNILTKNINFDMGVYDDNYNNKLRVIYNEEHPNSFFVVNQYQIVEIDFTGNIINSKKFNFPLTLIYSMGEAKLDKTLNKIQILFRGPYNSSSESYVVIANLDVFGPNWSIDAYALEADNIQALDNLNIIQNGLAFSGKSNNDIMIFNDNYDLNECAIPLNPSLIDISLSSVEEPILNVGVLNYSVKYPDFTNVNHYPIDKGYYCTSISDESCESCNGINENTFELILSPVSKNETECCYDIIVNNNGPCDYLDLQFKISKNETLIITKDMTNTELKMSASNVLGQVCIPTSDVESTFIKLEVNDIGQNPSLMCGFSWTEEILCDKQCCDLINVISLEAVEPVDNIFLEPCCFNLEYSIDPNININCADYVYIKIKGDDNNILFEGGPISLGLNKIIKFCIPPNSNYLELNNNVTIEFTDEFGNLLCTSNNNYTMDLTKCKCCDFDIDIEQFFPPDDPCQTDVTLSGFNPTCDVASIDVVQRCGDISSGVFYNTVPYYHHDSFTPEFPFDDIWIFWPTCSFSNCDINDIEVTITYADGSKCTKTEDIECCWIYSGKPTISFEEYMALGIKNYPNPANNSTALSFNLAEEKPLTLEVLSVTGNSLGTIYSDMGKKGLNTIDVNTSVYAPGVYIFVIHLGDKVTTHTFQVE